MLLISNRTNVTSDFISVNDSGVPHIYFVYLFFLNSFWPWCIYSRSYTTVLRFSSSFSYHTNTILIWMCEHSKQHIWKIYVVIYLDHLYCTREKNKKKYIENRAVQCLFIVTFRLYWWAKWYIRPTTKRLLKFYLSRNVIIELLTLTLKAYVNVCQKTNFKLKLFSIFNSLKRKPFLFMTLRFFD